eukprot:309741-Prymnesium_polylepis.1
MRCVCVLRVYGARHADGARVGDAQQIRRSHARPCTHKSVVCVLSQCGHVVVWVCETILTFDAMFAEIDRAVAAQSK